MLLFPENKHHIVERNKGKDHIQDENSPTPSNKSTLNQNQKNNSILHNKTISLNQIQENNSIPSNHNITTSYNRGVMLHTVLKLMFIIFLRKFIYLCRTFCQKEMF